VLVQTHIAFEIVWHYGCVPAMRCSHLRLPWTAFNTTTTLHAGGNASNHSSPTVGTSIGSDQQALPTTCVTAPFVLCGNESINLAVTTRPHVPLWNLHVHSKHTRAYMSEPCDCASAVG
jgi:hypothetical protein